MNMFERMNITDYTAIIAVILSIIAIIYTYKGVKVSKYIETITAQRIKWIDTLRSDLSVILSLAVLFNATKKAEDATAWWQSEDEIPSDPEDKIKMKKILSEREKNKEKVNRMIKAFNATNTIELAILRLNEIDDSELINELEKLLGAFLADNEKIIDDAFIINLRKMIKILLKNEWEKVKAEVMKGGRIYGRKNFQRDTFWQ